MFFASRFQRLSGSKNSFSTTQRKSISSSSLKFQNYGNIDSALSLQQENINKDSTNSVVVKFLASPINPGDFNIIQGVYGRSSQFPAVAGIEGVAVVEDSSDPSFTAGDWVVPASTSLGTWRTYAVCQPSDLIKIPKDIPATSASVLPVNASTAYRLLEDFVSLKRGDVIIQNAANSTVGQSIIQLAKEKGVRTINVVRSREAKEFTKLQHFLQNLGADEVVQEEKIQNRAFKSVIERFGAPTLAINATGGQSATDIARLLKEGGTFVTIGGMSRKPVVLPTSLLLFKDITCQGFWITRWIEEHSVQERTEMLKKLSTLVKEGKLKFSIEEVPFSEYPKALARSQTGRKDTKVVLKF